MKKATVLLLAAALFLTGCEEADKEKMAKRTIIEPVLSKENCTKEYDSKIKDMMDSVSFAEKCYVHFGIDYRDCGFDKINYMKNQRKSFLEKQGKKSQ